jgi:hypothetical protein
MEPGPSSAVYTQLVNKSILRAGKLFGRLATPKIGSMGIDEFALLESALPEAASILKMFHQVWKCKLGFVETLTLKLARMVDI